MGLVRSVNKRGVAAWRWLVHHARLRDQPRVLCNSFQKSGTHLLVGLVQAAGPLRGYQRRAYWHHLNRARVAARKRPVLQAELARLGRASPGEICRGHLGADPRVVEFLERERFVHLFGYRDPRDVVVSLLHWWERHDEIESWPFLYFGSLDSPAERLRFLIEGWPEGLSDSRFPAECDYPNIGARFAEFAPWLSNPHCLAVRFEDLVDDRTKAEAYRRIAAAVFPDADPDATVARMEAGSAPEGSRTFRAGRSGDWRETFEPEHVAAMKRCAGQLLIDLGYEKDLDW
jgi:hypothetical protein